MPDGANLKKLKDLIRWFESADEVSQNYCETTCMPIRRCKSHCAECPKPVLLPDNVDAYDLFFACYTQFVVDNFGVPQIAYSEVKVAADWLGIKVTEEVFAKFRVMERELKSIRVHQNGQESSGINQV
ncbi:MAG: hypothetical protein Tp1111SUR522732_14 [Prokaryotic dsDNA virus sp.]|uniref:DUF1799 domain-containing protein n=1 Tax=Methylophaga sp. UBA2689 TaxID=1946878 RepID=UPI0011887A2F|nr:DUF1799 domain-containing protein [Methylophaga sp. UBA2689]QDP47076.1 MAG: hypothetical protein Tp1111SUR522732_14 [Prokaryotic dsDNA virus sp.]